MDRSLKWRTLGLLGIIALCVGILLPSITDVPSWFPFSKKINLGLDLQGGSHIVYSIDLDTAVADRASDVKRNLDARFLEETPKVEATVKTPDQPIGTVVVVPKDAAKGAEITAMVKADYGDSIDARECLPEEKEPNAVCFQVSKAYAESIKKSALANAVNTIRERIDEKGVAEPTVVQKDDQIIVELPGLDDEQKQATRDVIARTAKLEFKIVDDGTNLPGWDPNRPRYMLKLYQHVGVDESDRKNPKAREPIAAREGIRAEIETWKPEEGGGTHTDYFLMAYDRREALTEAEARESGCLKRTERAKLEDGKVWCEVEGRQIIQRYLDNLAKTDPSFKIPDDREIAYELVEPATDATDKRSFWRTYYLDKTVQLTGTSIQDAMPSYDPNTNRPIVLLDFNRFGSRVFGDLTAKIVGMKLATILDRKVKSAPQINSAIRGGRASITMGGSDPRRQEAERDELVNVLKTGSLPAPLREESVSDVGPSLGRDAIDKTKVSFGIGVVLVIVIMIAIYKWSGWMSVFALVMHNLITLAIMALFGATLTLPGIAAIVLSVGMTVDGNILIYERIRDELLLGKSVRGAVDLGFTRAFSAIVDGQLTTAVAGWVLLQYGSGPIKGFAVMLLVGVFTTVLTNTWITRIFFDWYIARKKGAMATISI